jgi:beta-glucosidase
MPGSNKDYKEVLKGLKNGTLSREQLQISATRVYRMAKRLAKQEQIKS